MRYVKNNTIKTLTEVRNENPNMSIPYGADLSDIGYAFLIETEKPMQDGYNAIEVTPVDNIQTWELVAIPIEEYITAKKKAIEKAVQFHLDSKAIDKGYESILSACSYSGHTNPFQDEGKAFVEWRGNVWAYCYQVLSDVQGGTRQEPTIEELIAELPALVLP